MKQSTPRIKGFEPTTLAEVDGARYDSILASVGYERRSRQIPEALDIAGVAIPFGDRHDLDYDANKRFFDDHRWAQPSIEEEDYFSAVSRWLSAVLSDESDKTPRVAVDVSSMSRRRIADVVEAVLTLPAETRLDVDFLYTPAVFAEPDDTFEPPVFKVAPVSSYLAGWWSDLEKPLFVIVGVGYELERAASALDVLEPEATQVHVPRGSDPKYLEAVYRANTGLIDSPSIASNEVFYDVANPFECFRRLEASISRLSSDHRVAVVPLGPKIFALSATLAAALHPMGVQVIRVSAGQRQRPLQRESDGDLYGLTLSLRPPPEFAD